jgi:hypothetical protein
MAFPSQYSPTPPASQICAGRLPPHFANITPQHLCCVNNCDEQCMKLRLICGETYVNVAHGTSVYSHSDL